jgi:hypothetical protein
MPYSTTSVARETEYQDGKVVAVCVKTGEVINKGDIVIIKAADGLAYKAFAAASCAAGDMFAGIAYESMTSTADTDVVRVWTVGIHNMVGAGLSQSDVGAKVWHDAGTTGAPNAITTSSGDAAHTCAVGVIASVPSATTARVRIDGYAMSIGGIAA